MKNKKGQFYIVAAIIVVLALSGIAGTTTYAVAKSKPRTIHSLSLDLKEEGSRVIDYGIYSGDDKIEDFAIEKFAPYFLQKTDNANVVFIYGDKTNLYGVEYETVSTGTISASIGGGINWESVSTFAKKVHVSDDGDGKIDVTILDDTYEFDLKNNEMFYFVMIQEKKGERYVERN